MNRNAVVTGILLFVVFIVGFGLGRMTTGVGGGVIENSTGLEEFSEVFNPPNNNDTVAPTSQNGTTVNTSSLSDSQRRMIESFGIDPDSITITPEMIACAEAKLGSARIEEIKNGATPSFSEGASLMACYR